MQVAIDGPAGSGKSTVARALAERLGLTYLDTGAMYRSVAAECLREGVDVHDDEATGAVARRARIEFGPMEAGRQSVSVNGRDVTAEIRTPEVDRAVSPVSASPAVREALLGQQRAFGEAGDVVAEGRDIGTVVFPQAAVKVFLTADDTARAHRRAVERAGGDTARDPHATADAAEEAKVLADLRRRDELDSTRAAAPLRAAADAVRIDSSALGVEEVVAQVAALVEAARAHEGGEERG